MWRPIHNPYMGEDFSLQKLLSQAQQPQGVTSRYLL